MADLLFVGVGRRIRHRREGRTAGLKVINAYRDWRSHPSAPAPRLHLIGRMAASGIDTAARCFFALSQPVAGMRPVIGLLLVSRRRIFGEKGPYRPPGHGVIV